MVDKIITVWAITNWPAADQIVKMYASVDAIKLFQTSNDSSEYNIWLFNFCVKLSIYVSEFNPDELNNLGIGTLSAFTYPLANAVRIS